jgi:hypothetical protein
MSTEIGIAVLFVMQSDGTVTHDVFREDDPGAIDDPYHRALTLWFVVENDMPDALHSIAQNDRARELKTQARMKAMGL